MVLPDSLEAGERGRRATCRSATTCSSSRSRPNRPDCLARLRGRARAARGHGRAAGRRPRRPRTPSRPARAEADDHLSVEVDDFELCPRFSARVFTDVQVGPSPLWLKAAPDGGRAAPDLQRRRHHQLRDAAARPADARLRPRPRGRPAAARAQRARGRAADDARRRAARVRLRRRARLRRRRPDRDRRHHGRRGQRGLGRHDARRDGGRDLERPQHPPDLEEAGAAQRGERALREAAPSRARRCAPSGWRRG